MAILLGCQSKNITADAAVPYAAFFCHLEKLKSYHNSSTSWRDPASSGRESEASGLEVLTFRTAASHSSADLCFTVISV